MKSLFTSIVLSLFALPTLFAQVETQFDASADWIAFMNVFELPANGGGYVFGSPWALADVKSTLNVAANTLTLQPNFNTYADNLTNPEWVNQTTGEGNRIMEANTFVEPGINDVDFTFSGSVQANTLAEGYTAKFFIKALDPDNNFSDVLGGAKIVDLPESGDFSVSATASELASGLLVQYGFTITGPNANPDDEATLGSVVITGEMTTGEANDVLFSAADTWTAFMNVSELPENGGAYVFGSPWALPDVKSTLDVDANTLTLQPNFNTYADNLTNPEWVNQTTGEGNRIMEALTFVEPGATFNGSDLTFRGVVQSYTLSDDYTTQFFIKALDPDNNFSDALGGMKTFDLPTSGEFEVSATADELAAGLLIQYGFAVTGRNANPDDEAALGSVVIGDMAVSVNELDQVDNSITVYPNPVSDLLSIQSDTQVESFQVTTLMGQLLLNGPTTNNVDVSNLAAGIYFITVQTEEGQKTIKFFKR